MKYGYTKLATNWTKEEMNTLGIRLLKAILFFIPRANPDHEKLYPNISKWFIELDENGIPCREIAIDKNGVPIFAAPDDRNFGFWTDSDEKFPEKDFDLGNKNEFETLWSQLQNNA